MRKGTIVSENIWVCSVKVVVLRDEAEAKMHGSKARKTLCSPSPSIMSFGVQGDLWEVSKQRRA